jgi:hypothetical protein
LDYLRTLKSTEGKELGLQILVNHQKLEGDAALKPGAKINLLLASVRLDKLLDLVFGRLGANYYLDDGIMVISSREDVDTRLELRVYNCRDVMDLPRRKPAAGDSARDQGDELVELIKSVIKPESWTDNGGPGTVEEYRGLLIISQTAERHREINHFLELLRQAAAKQTQESPKP